MQNMSSDRVCASSMHVRCMINAWASTHGAKCVKHTTNGQNMINMNNYGNPQKLVLIGVQESAKNTIKVFYQTPRVHSLHMYDEQCMNYTCMMNNAWTCEKLALIHVKMPQGVNTIINKHNGTKPNQQNRKNSQKWSFPIPKHEIDPTQGFMKSKTKSMDLKDEKG